MKIILPLGMLAATATLIAAIPATAAAPIGVVRAIEAAEAGGNGRAFGVEIDTYQGRPVYEVKLVRGNGYQKVAVDAMSSQVLSRNTPRIQGYVWRWTERAERAHLDNAKPLAEVIAALEARSGGTVTDASFEVEAGQPRYEVELATAAGTTDIYLDPKTGERLALVYDD